MSVPTWKQLRESLPKGIDGEAAEFIRRQTAGERHTARVGETARAALRKANEVLRDTHKPASDPDIFAVASGQWRAYARSANHLYRRETDCHLAPAHALVASVLCAIEVSGTGGPGDMGGDSRATVRADWAQSLGKGRSQASDGPAWTAAIGEAGQALRCTVTEACSVGLYEIPDSLDEESILILIASPQALSATRVRLLVQLSNWRVSLPERNGFGEKELASWAATFNEIERLCRESALSRANGLEVPLGA